MSKLPRGSATYLPDTSDSVLVLRFRRIFAILAGATAFGGLVELAMLRHWGTTAQIAPWVILTILTLAAVATLVGCPLRLTIGAGIIGIIGGGLGVYHHVEANWWHAGADLTGDQLSAWDAGSWLQHLWSAATGGVGPAPALAPGLLTLAGVLLVCATLGTHRPPGQPTDQRS